MSIEGAISLQILSYITLISDEADSSTAEREDGLQGQRVIMQRWPTFSALRTLALQRLLSKAQL